MPNRFRKIVRAIPTGLLKQKTRLSKNRKIIFKGFLKVMIVVLLLFFWSRLTEPVTYHITEGALTYKLEQGWPGGQIQFSLGPAGMLYLSTHKTPVNLEMNLVLASDLADNQSLAKTWEEGVAKFKPDAIHAFYDFLWNRFIWVALIGLALGVIVTNGGDHWVRRLLKNALYRGPLALVLLAGIFLGVTYLTLDRTPEARFTGLAKDLPTVIEAVKKMGSNYPVGKNVFRNVIDGLENVSAQVDRQSIVTTSGPRTRILVISDIHDNIWGMRQANDILSGSLGPFSAVIITGDITNFGRAEEANLFADRLKAKKVPVYLVGGNHEDLSAIETFRSLGYTVLQGQTIKIDDLSLVGESDPLATSYLIDSDQAALISASDDFALLWASFEDQPQVIAVHDIRQAEGVIELAKKQNQPLTVIFGHDHLASVKKDQSVNLIGGGTGGASGFDEIGRKPDTPYTYQILDFSRGPAPILLSVTTLSFEGLTGTSTATYTPIN